MQAIVPALAEHNASLVAMTPQLPEHHGTLIEKHGLAFELLSDPGNAYAASLGLRHDITGELREVYSGLGLDLPKHNGEESWTLPMPARVVADASGVVRAVDVDPDYTRRPEPDATVEAVKALG